MDTVLKRGCSGGAVIDAQGNLLGMITLAGPFKSAGGDIAASMALPVKTIARALMGVDAKLGRTIYGDVPEDEQLPVDAAAWTYAGSDASDAPEDALALMPELQVVRSTLPNAVEALRAKWQPASNLFMNLVANQCLAQTSGKPVCHELAIEKGEQVFRSLHGDDTPGKTRTSFPVQNHGVWVQSDWADAQAELSEYPWVFEGMVQDRYYLFSLKSSVEDDRCSYEGHQQGAPLFSKSSEWDGAVDCVERVLTDKDYNVVSMFTEMMPPDDCATELFGTVIYFDDVWLKGSSTPIRVPMREEIVAKIKGQKKLVHANVTWTGYRKFRAEHKVDFSPAS